MSHLFEAAVTRSRIMAPWKASPRWRAVRILFAIAVSVVSAFPLAAQQPEVPRKPAAPAPLLNTGRPSESLVTVPPVEGWEYKLGANEIMKAGLVPRFADKQRSGKITKL